MICEHQIVAWAGLGLVLILLLWLVAFFVKEVGDIRQVEDELRDLRARFPELRARSE